MVLPGISYYSRWFTHGLACLWTESYSSKRECLANCSWSKIFEIVSGKLSKCVLIYPVICTLRLHLRLTSVFWSITFKTAAPRMSLITRNAKEYRRQSKYDCTINVTKCTWALPSGFSVLRHPNHVLLAGANNRNVIITWTIPCGPCSSKSRFSFPGILTIGAFHYTGPTGPRPLGLTKRKWNPSDRIDCWVMCDFPTSSLNFM